MMNLSEYATSRKIKLTAVSMFLKRHSEFNGLYHREGKSIILSDEAIELLDKTYSDSPKFEILDTALADKVDKLQAYVIELQKQIIKQSETINLLTQEKVNLLEDKQLTNVKYEERINEMADKINVLEEKEHSTNVKYEEEKQKQLILQEELKLKEMREKNLIDSSYVKGLWIIHNLKKGKKLENIDSSFLDVPGYWKQDKKD